MLQIRLRLHIFLHTMLQIRLRNDRASGDVLHQPRLAHLRALLEQVLDRVHDRLRIHAAVLRLTRRAHAHARQQVHQVRQHAGRDLYA